MIARKDAEELNCTFVVSNKHWVEGQGKLRWSLEATVSVWNEDESTDPTVNSKANRYQSCCGVVCVMSWGTEQVSIAEADWWGPGVDSIVLEEPWPLRGRVCIRNEAVLSSAVPFSPAKVEQIRPARHSGPHVLFLPLLHGSISDTQIHTLMHTHKLTFVALART